MDSGPDAECTATVVMTDGAFMQWKARTPEVASFQQVTGAIAGAAHVTKMGDAAWRAWTTTDEPEPVRMPP